MLSRRSVRIKVMQILYAIGSDEKLVGDQIVKRYWSMVDNSYDVFLFNLYNILNVTKMAIEDDEKRKTKHLPTAEDKTFTAKLCENELIESIRNNDALHKLFDKKGFVSGSDRDHFKKLYTEFSKEEAYQAYLKKDSTKEDHVEILLELYRFLRKSELFNEIIEDRFINWTDDKSLVIGSIKKVIKSLPVSGTSFLKEFYPDDETVKEYGETLLLKTCDGEEALLKLIKPLLVNWDHERLALIDIALMKMATCEMLEFKSIPARVTLNEYVEVAKNYSTDKSKEFVNGVLDKLMKQLEAEGKLNKEGRGTGE